MSAVDTTANEAFESLNGFDEIAITKAFGTDVSAMRTTPTTFLRALVFVERRRSGLNDHDARAFAFNLALRDVLAYFAEDADEFDPDEPVTDEGKGDSPSA